MSEFFLFIDNTLFGWFISVRETQKLISQYVDLDLQWVLC